MFDKAMSSKGMKRVQLYLYGKKKFLGELIEGSKGIRLSDIAHYSIMENDLMRDNELEKIFVWDKDQVKIKVNDFLIDPQSITANPSVSIRPDRCFCVCFSTKRNDPELFARFEADVCIEIDLVRLLEVLRLASSSFDGMEVLHGPVNYYPEIMKGPLPDLRAVLFYKRDIYMVESEYRVALSIPPNKKTFKGPSGAIIDIFSDDPKDIRHLFINGNAPETNRRYVKGAYYL